MLSIHTSHLEHPDYDDAVRVAEGEKIGSNVEMHVLPAGDKKQAARSTAALIVKMEKETNKWIEARGAALKGNKKLPRDLVFGPRRTGDDKKTPFEILEKYGV